MSGLRAGSVKVVQGPHVWSYSCLVAIPCLTEHDKKRWVNEKNRVEFTQR